jgi:integrase
MRSNWVSEDTMSHVLAALTPPNRLAMVVALRYGLRIDDVLHLKTTQLLRGRFSVTEMKTGKRRRISITGKLQCQLLRQAGEIYVFEGRLDTHKPRTRQAVYKDVVRAAKLFRVADNLTPHSARKIYAASLYHECGGDIQEVQHRLNHSDPSVTMIYALSDLLSKEHDD